MFFLDTNTCVYFLNGKYPSIREKILTTSPQDIHIPSIVKAELIYGAYKSKKKEENIEKVEMFLEPFEIVPFEDRMGYLYAEIRSVIEKKGTIIGPNDLLIASIVKFHNGILVSNNVREFKRVPGLLIENLAI